jgi:7-cyano-7-deazaguanine reductase
LRAARTRNRKYSPGPERGATGQAKFGFTEMRSGSIPISRCFSRTNPLTARYLETSSNVPSDRCIELKSLKLYLWSYRNDGIFYERAVNRILDDLVASSSPRWMRVIGDFNVRGGVKSVITATHGKQPSSK